MVDAKAAAAIPYRKRIRKLEDRIEVLEALLRDAVAALDDLGACDDSDCRDEDCPRVLPRIRAALPERPENA
ncbi:hypothetical protein ACIBEJ_34870 [Nonomuraea sp. NPDC050790]|uniref:hypothetical protein n=1 Tax=Nonomuraea sp. NPDC050790 TaxID=3364371 RepID=UPI00378F6535